jgi:peptidoglycan hydrolase-like protein with peptidoglycan-binding domain
MGVVTERLLFLAFLVMTATIVYNALYLQEHALHNMAGASSPGQAKTRVIGVEPPSASSAASGAASEYKKSTQPSGSGGPVGTDLPDQGAGAGKSRLVVRAIQRELTLRGFDVGRVDGQLSEKTRKAISAFQMREGLAVTGLPTDDVLRQILLGDTIGNSDTTSSIPADDSIAANAPDGSTVLRVQQVLAELGYAPGTIDGAWGQKTAEAVRAFQRDRNMALTGSLTPELLAEFQRVTGRNLTRTAARR